LFTPCNAKPILLGHAPWNEIHPEKHLFQSIPVVPLFQNSCNLKYAIPRKFCNSNVRVFQKAPPILYLWSFFASILKKDTSYLERKIEHQSKVQYFIGKFKR
jgi:hypothetical protein